MVFREVSITCLKTLVKNDEMRHLRHSVMWHHKRLMWESRQERLIVGIERLNSIVDDIAGEIGYTAASALVDWFGGGYLYVPKEFSEKHPISLVIGDLGLRRLIKAYAGESLAIPYDFGREKDRRDRLIAVLGECGCGTRQIASIAGMTPKQVQNIRRRITDSGLLPFLMKRAGLTVVNAGEKRVEKAGGNSSEKRREKAGGNAGGKSRR